MITALSITIVIVGALGYALSPKSHDKMITHRPYNNRYNDASGAREQ